MLQTSLEISPTKPPTKVKDMTSLDINTISRPKWPFHLHRNVRGPRQSGRSFLRLIRARATRLTAYGLRLKHGTLMVKSGDGGQLVALRLKAGDPSRIQVDAGDNGSADFSFARSDVHAIKVRMGNGNDSVRIDDANGAFTDSIPTTIAGGNGNDSLKGGQLGRARTRVQGRRRQRHGRRRQGQRHRLPRRWQRHLPLGSRRGQRRDRGPGRQRHDAVQRCRG